MVFESVFKSVELTEQILHQTAAVLVPWAKNSNPDFNIITNWLEGRDLPLLGLNDEPWRVIG